MKQLPLQRHEKSLRAYPEFGVTPDCCPTPPKSVRVLPTDSEESMYDLVLFGVAQTRSFAVVVAWRPT